jgi:hypothetical protein
MRAAADRREQARAYSQRGSGVLEATLSITVIAVLMWVLSDRLLDYIRLADQAVVQQTVGTMRTAMYLEVARRAGTGDMRSIKAMAGGNPVLWLAQPPDGYLGELRRPEPRELPGGAWYFDVERGELAYVPRRLAWRASLPAEGAFKFAVRVLQPDAPAGRIAGISGVELKPTATYAWFGN